ncbi:aspartic peptidase domain-containing protein [Cyathus striatus]|nr:aspartic peptidase domain-containing protein [Cyathus striatus]
MWSFLSWLVAFLASLVLVAEASSERGLSIVPRSNPITVQLHSRATAYNGTSASLTSVSLSSDRQSYFALLQAGNISFRVALDTASSDLWLLSSECQTTTCKNTPRYPLTYQSPTFTPVNNNATTFNVQYADGTVASGFVARETVQIANIVLANQTLGVVTSSNVSLVDETSGVLGLGFPRLSSFSGLVANSGILDYPLFALSLTRNSSGSLSLGAIDSSVVTNTSLINWNRVAQFPPFGAENNVSSYLQWTIPLAAFSVNVSQLLPIPTYPNATSNRSLTLFDVGASGLYGPYQDVSRLYSLIDGARLVDAGGQWAVPCDTTVPLTFTFGTQNYTMQPSDYIIGPASGNPNLCLSWPRALPPSADGIDWQLGAAFLRTVYSIFSFGINGKEPPMIGLYLLQNATNIAEAPEYVASVLSSLSATVATTLPNFPLSTPTFSTPSYTLNASVTASVGAIVTTGLATSIYSPILGGQGTSVNASAMPTIVPTPSLVTLIVTNPAGEVTTSISTYSMAAVTLGVPPGWSGATNAHASFALLISSTIFIWTMLSLSNII